MSDAPPKTDVLTEEPGPELRLKLVVVAGPDFGAELVLDKGNYAIGKHADNDLVLGDGAISQTHLLVAVLPQGVRLTDNGSTNGSFYAGMRFSTLEVQPGAVVRIGRTELQLVPALEQPASLHPSDQTRFGKLVGKSLRMRQLYAALERVAPTDTTVLIQGETGTGKELCAEALHQASLRADRPFVVCDMAAISPSLLESELFGHVRGAFTGSAGDRAGAFEQAHGGTLFFDEIGELPLEQQPKLLRAIERREIKPVGGGTYRTVDVRVVAATHRDLGDEVSKGRFREDLYYRLSVVTLSVPPLRDRIEDLPLLVAEILRGLGRSKSEISAETLALLGQHAWPGNVRELRNVVERAVSLGGAAALPMPRPMTPSPAVPLAGEPLGFKEAKERIVSAFERDYLVDLLRRCQGNLSLAARTAGVDRAYLYRLLKKHGSIVQE